MYPFRRFSHTFLHRIYCSSSNRYQSSTTSSSDKTEKSSVDSASWATSDTNGLIKQLSTRIKAGGPITIAEFMRESLLNPNYVRYLLEYSFFLLSLLPVSKLD